ncbi:MULTISPECIES: 2-amino-4-hydroxy-6-hydroxymethyldihydropteridine diphosphokinase [Zhongshania]|jgi:2-amino-4-hydroxy-6-hydroxymethyldihydropteridine diphosphokinase|uniref:2-amino-4-hydroxy-6-hydroxymethyldihydropteridine pyrophosphokinase n=1 Tax=Zhongshania antarctica TaxID=641702 RepID=A0A840R4U3_9GAMM|nr:MULTISPECIES: 2-amino-4-hydroxy-6-hydroxymethyldihydropteridine diphosphokinase [Zhongshania]MBB5187618.1 2-amino-4-hydroxy-6-hydroxymethyldihydropteridine diphosphokinase [Zhongshania antarctica]
MIRCYIALGSNLGEPQKQVRSALSALAALPNSALVNCSRLYGSIAVGPGQQNDYVNAVAALDTTLTAAQLLAAMQRIEAQHQRRRAERWGPRTLDLDLLLYGESRINTDTLCVPHPRMHQRDFVLRPLTDIAPQKLLQSEFDGINSGTFKDTDDLWVLNENDQSQSA